MREKFYKDNTDTHDYNGVPYIYDDAIKSVDYKYYCKYQKQRGSQCKKKFKKFSHFTRHAESVHLKTKCQDCTYFPPQRGRSRCINCYRQRRTRRRRRSKSPCRKCGKLLSPQNRRRHERHHCPRVPRFQCLICYIDFCQKKDLIAHLKKTHGKTFNNSDFKAIFKAEFKAIFL